MSRLYLFTQERCARCPAMKARLLEEGISFEEIDMRDVSVDMTMNLLKSNIVIYMTPALIREEDGRYKKTTLEELIIDRATSDWNL